MTRSTTLPGKTQDSIRLIQDRVRKASAWVEPVHKELSRVIVGQDEMVRRLLVVLLTNGHILLEGATGLAKSLTLQSLADAIQTGFGRIQFSPDMLPSDILGTEVYDPAAIRFEAKPGPVFGNLVLADDIHRGPAKVQSALLEAMRSRRVKLGDRVLTLPDPFLVVATTNPADRDGTPLSAAQLDRFMLKVVVPFPSVSEERMILDVADRGGERPRVRTVTSMDEIREARKVACTVHVDEKVKDYIVSLVYATREPMGYGLDLDPYLRHGASPRASLSLLAAGRATAFLNGRAYVTPEDIKEVALDVLRHRVGLTYEAEAEDMTRERIVRQILDTVIVP